MSSLGADAAFQNVNLVVFNVKMGQNTEGVENV